MSAPSLPKFNPLLLFLFLAFAHVKLLAQAPPILWQRCYGGDSTDFINCIKQTSDGGFIAAGRTRSVNGDLIGNGGIKGMWVLKLDPLGNIQWEKTYNDTLYNARYIEQTTDGGYILVGNQVIKLHPDGSVEWLDNIVANIVHQTRDGGYILCYSYDPGLTKLNADGSIAWLKSYNAFPWSDEVTITDVCQSDIDGYMITGTTYDIFHSPFMSKTDDTGKILFPLPEDMGHGGGIRVCNTVGGKYIAVDAQVNGFWIYSVDDSCIERWRTPTITDINFGCVAGANDGGAVLCGNNNIFYPNFGVRKYDNSGLLQWQKSLGGSMADLPTSILQATNGNYVVAGYTQSNDSDVSGNHGGIDGWIVEFGTNVAVPGVPANSAEIQIYPIPSTDIVHIDLPKGYENAILKLIDVSGRTVSVKEDNKGLTRALYLDGLAPGEYLLQVIDNGVYRSKTIVHY